MDRCISCKGEFQKIGECQGFNILRCKVCGLGRTFGEKMGYRNYHRDKIYQDVEEQFKNIFLKRVLLISKYQKKGRVLDIGSSIGAMLSLFKDRGWEILGVEPSELASSVALKKGIPTINSVFPSKKVKRNFFDAVVANHVLEHVDDPLAFLGEVAKALKKEGVVLISVPNFASLSAKMYGVRWQYILPKEHLWHFTPLSLKNLLEKVGFVVIFFETRSGIWDYSDPFGELTTSLFTLKKRFFKNLFTAPFSYLVSKIGFGTSLTMLARKI